MNVFIFGNKGNMGCRYTAILKHLGHEVYGTDIGDSVIPNLDEFDAFIVATPTETHLAILNTLLDCKRPVLCEKPIVANEDLTSLYAFIEKAKRAKMQLTMVSQYDYLVNNNATGRTHYNYFKSGKDGIAWDCINIIYHANDAIVLKTKSPVWMCMINNHKLKLQDMDYAYIDMIRTWLMHPYEPQYDRIIKAHKKVVEYLKWKEI